MSYPKDFEHLKIPLSDIRQATEDFHDKYAIAMDALGMVYKGVLCIADRLQTVAIKRLHDQDESNFCNEIMFLSNLKHQNIVSLIGFCHEDCEMILIFDFPTYGSLETYLSSAQLTWLMRVQICLDTACGLQYLHENPSQRIIHGDLTSDSIQLYENWQAKLRLSGLRNVQLLSTIYTNVIGRSAWYLDPEYMNTGILTTQSDIYSFGVILFEVLCGSAYMIYKDSELPFLSLVRRHYESGTLTEIIDPVLRVQMNRDSLNVFSMLAYRCLEDIRVKRPKISEVVEGLEKVLRLQKGFEMSELQQLIGVENISLEEIMSATNRFSDERVIGKGPPGKIYKGELLLFKRYIPVAVKRLDKVGSYGEGALLKEVVKLSHYSHKNIITIRGFCEEDNEKIIIMDHASNESLDRHLDKSILTWGIRLKISIGAAKGLNHIHSFEEDQKTLHGNIKSSNVLLDHDWEATISNFIISKSHGTLGYLDPQSYSGMTKKSDVYSFGVVLFELLSGKLAIEKAEKYSHHTLRQIINDERQRYAGDGAEDKNVVFLAWMAARCFEENKLEALIFDDLMEKTDAKSIDVVSKVAYQCLHKDQEKRPTMALVIQELEKALNIHEEWECEQKLPKDYERIMKMIEHPESQKITKKELYSRLSSGTRLNNEKVWLSLSKDEKVKELISATMFSYENCWSFELKVLENSRFGTVAKISNSQNLKIPIEIKTQFLSLGIIYGAYLVFKFCDPKMVSSKPYVDLKYKTASGELNSYIAERRDGEWMMIELCRFRSDNQIIDFKVQLESLWGHPCGSGPIFVDGIEFRPIDNAAHEESVGRLMNAESSVNQDQQSPSDYQEIMKRSQYDVLTMNKQELDKLLSTGVLIDNGEKLFSLSKVNCKNCHMLPAKAVINKSPDTKFTECPSSAMSRFEEVVELPRHKAFSIKCNIETELLSPDTAYACYLVFQLPENSEGLRCPVKARDLLNKNNKESTIIYLKAPGPVDLYRDKRVPNRREDGWMEVRVWEFVFNNEIKDIPMELKLVCLGGTMLGLTVRGIEFRPL